MKIIGDFPVARKWFVSEPRLGGVPWSDFRHPLRAMALRVVAGWFVPASGVLNRDVFLRSGCTHLAGSCGLENMVDTLPQHASC